MRKRVKFEVSAVVGALVLGWSAAFGQTFNSGSTGADGAFAPTANTTLTLPASGVFNFTTINIPAGVTVTFARNTTNTPVTLLASGNVTIAGIIDLNGTAGGNQVTGTTRLGRNGGSGGPGGFDGGDGANGIASTTGGSGLGPGGGGGGPSSLTPGGGAGFLDPGGTSSGGGAGGATYGTPQLLPLIGGSGGGGQGGSLSSSGAGGGGGGGAILIASSGTITLTGTIRARGGTGGLYGASTYGGAGSGGAVRLVATTLTGSNGTIDVRGGGTFGGSPGRVRIEAYTNTATITFTANVAPSVTQPTVVTLPNTPTLRIASVAGVAAPASPASSFSNPDIVLPASTANPVAVNLEASNIPLGTTVTVKVTGQTGAATSATSTGLSGTVASSTASASVTIPTNQPSIISATATFTLVSLGVGGPVYAQGEAVERVQVTAVHGGPSIVTYLTASGNELPAEQVAWWVLGGRE